MIIGLIVILCLVLILPFVFKRIEHNLEYFLFFMGLSATIITGILNFEFIAHIFSNKLLYFITAAVLIAGLIFNYSIEKIKSFVHFVLKYVPLKIFVFILVVFLGLVSSLITAIIAALVLVEILHALPIPHKTKVKLSVVSCFSIGLGAALTPIGEPLSTIVTSTLNADFGFLFRELGIYVIPLCFLMGILGLLITHRDHVGVAAVSDIPFDLERKILETSTTTLSEVDIENKTEDLIDEKAIYKEEVTIKKEEHLSAVFLRAFKIFVFVIALELLGAGFKPLINTYCTVKSFQ